MDVLAGASWSPSLHLGATTLQNHVGVTGGIGLTGKVHVYGVARELTAM